MPSDEASKYRTLFEDNPRPMWVFEPGTRKFLEVNATALGLYEYSREEFHRLTLSDVQVPAAESGCGEAMGVCRHRTKSGRIIEVEMSVCRIQYGGVDAELAVIVDVTGRRLLEEQLRQAQKMETVGLLAGGIAHDFNNLLTIITGYTQLVLNRLPALDPNRDSAEEIMKASTRAAALTKQLLGFSRRKVPQPRQVDLNQLVRDVCTILRRLIGEDIDLKVALTSEPIAVHVDPNQIEQVIMNLAINARDALPKGGTLTLETRRVDVDGAYASRKMDVKPGPYVMLAVSDNGVGMDAATRNRAFEPFFTTKGEGKGTGLGLSTVYAVVRQSGGGVHIYSEPDHGTCVKIYLPRIDRPVFAEPERLPQELTRGSEAVLVVEDDEMVRKVVRDTLVRNGYTVIDAGNPTDAKRLADNYDGHIHLLITDVVMPKISGRQLAAQLRRKRPGLLVLFMSGYTDEAIENTGLLPGEVPFLGKPFSPRALAEKVREVLGGDNRIRQAV